MSYPNEDTSGDQSQLGDINKAQDAHVHFREFENSKQGKQFEEEEAEPVSTTPMSKPVSPGKLVMLLRYQPASIGVIALLLWAVVCLYWFLALRSTLSSCSTNMQNTLSNLDKVNSLLDICHVGNDTFMNPCPVDDVRSSEEEPILSPVSIDVDRVSEGLLNVSRAVSSTLIEIDSAVAMAMALSKATIDVEEVARRIGRSGSQTGKEINATAASFAERSHNGRELCIDLNLARLAAARRTRYNLERLGKRTRELQAAQILPPFLAQFPYAILRMFWPSYTQFYSPQQLRNETVVATAIYLTALGSEMQDRLIPMGKALYGEYMAMNQEIQSIRNLCSEANTSLERQAKEKKRIWPKNSKTLRDISSLNRQMEFITELEDVMKHKISAVGTMSIHSLIWRYGLIEKEVKRLLEVLNNTNAQNAFNVAAFPTEALEKEAHEMGLRTAIAVAAQQRVFAQPWHDVL